MTNPPRQRDTAHFIIIFLLVSFNLRMSFSAADPLLARLMKALHMGVGSSSLFGLLPIMALGVAAPLGAKLVQWVRPGVLIIYALLFATAGVVWRSSGELPGLFGGTLIIGLGLGVAGSVILGMARQATPGHVPELMSAYTACVSLGTAVGAGVATPLEELLGSWRAGLLIWALPLLAATGLWSLLVLRRQNERTMQRAMKAPMLPLLKQRNARVISLYYLFRVASAWLLIVWLATLMKERGLSAAEAGWVLALATACQIPSAFLSGLLSRWMGGIHRLMSVATILAAHGSTACTLAVGCCMPGAGAGRHLLHRHDAHSRGRADRGRHHSALRISTRQRIHRRRASGLGCRHGAQLTTPATRHGHHLHRAGSHRAVFRAAMPYKPGGKVNIFDIRLRN